MAENFAKQEFELPANKVVPLKGGNATLAALSSENLYTTPELASIFGASTRTVRQWAAEVRSAWNWFDYSAFKRLGKHTEFVRQQIADLKDFRDAGGVYSEWKANISKLRPAEALASKPSSLEEVDLDPEEGLDPEEQSPSLRGGLINSSPSPMSRPDFDWLSLYDETKAEFEDQENLDKALLEEVEQVEAELEEQFEAVELKDLQNRQIRRRRVARMAVMHSTEDFRDYKQIYQAHWDSLEAKHNVPKQGGNGSGGSSSKG
ncbi:MULTISPECIES: hypothetical protein [unclassified Coleofasciculus]|uniref:hypothetical protein n=1 Tax=unclassified Coleofasciculus TaxID=2692782 RepID=UPI0018829BAB|nr:MULTISPECIES: hypothetical protein [unclassified Coleofasciculus]MBE9124744.1 hypothetical protein [Coleofasciculus sp. LEGE 07081]MBE9148196.1 hypothetical protein [Coleofasciculus sp. LEGE 07092]